MGYIPKCDYCGRFMRPGAPGSSWVMVPACDIPGEWGDERDRCAACTEKHGPAVCSPKYRADLCCGVIPNPEVARQREKERLMSGIL